MLDFQPVFRREQTIAELTGDLTRDDLRNLTNEIIDHVQGLIADCTDADVMFIPDDPKADDPGAPEDERYVAWTLGHVLVHTTAGSEEAAALAAELARGVEYHGRSRSEVPWRTVTTIAQCRHRLEESRRMRLASLEMWPDQPHLDNVHEPIPGFGPMNAVARFALGLAHESMHLEQIAEIVRQATEARAQAVA